MIFLTKSNAKERCRTCLRKLLKDEDNACDIESVITFPSKFVDINSNKELQEMLSKYFSTQLEENFNKDQMYPQYICIDCFKQLQAFEIFRNKALDNAKKLYEIFSDNCNVPKIELNDDGLECKIDVEEHSTDCVKDNIYNIFLKDSLMETEAIILNEECSNNDVNVTDPDPFQNTQKKENKRKPRARKTKSKTSYISNSKTTMRKSKSSSFKANESILNKATEQSENKISRKENEAADETLDWRDCTFQDSDNDSSDNEVLSMKILHSDKNVKETNNVKDENSFTNHDCTIIQSKKNVKERKFPNLIHENIDKNSSETIKMEQASNVDVSSDSDFDVNADVLLKPLKVEKKKRHYILNSGRKKGLANRYKCDQCQHKFGHKLTLEAHVRKVHEGQKKAFKCQLCDKAYSFIGGLSTHIRDVHERKQDSYDCSIPGCDKKYSNFITLQRHVRLKHLNMEMPHQYVCEQCGATFKQSSNLRYHMRTRHPTEEDLKRKELLPKDRLECEECKKSFHSQYTLKYHKLRVHADEKKFECKICGRRVAKQFMLDSHMLVHSDQKMACKFCGREFVRKYQVEAHIRAVHQKLKPFQCPHCSESFASRKTLRHHIYIHTGEKPYVCDVCGQAYRQPTCLKNHRKIHNKQTANNAPTALAANRNFISNFVQNNDNVMSNDKNLVLK